MNALAPGGFTARKAVFARFSSGSIMSPTFLPEAWLTWANEQGANGAEQAFVNQ